MSKCSQDYFNFCKSSGRKRQYPDSTQLINLIDDFKIEIQHVAKSRTTRQKRCQTPCTSSISQRTCTTLILLRTRHLLALYVSNNLWNIQNSHFTVFKVWLLVHTGLNPYYWRQGIRKAGKNINHIMDEKSSVLFLPFKLHDLFHLVQSHPQGNKKRTFHELTYTNKVN